jgi:predicted dehydrogenase
MPTRHRQRLGVGFVGAGGLVRERLAPGLRAIPGVKLVNVATSDPASGARAAAELGFERSASDWRRVVDDRQVDAVVVATWPDLHAPVTLAALDAGKHVLTTGRMAMDATEAARMLAASRARRHLVAMLVPGAFSLWADRAISRILAEGTLGDLRSVRLTWSGGVYGTDPWRRLRRHSGNNVMALGIVHEAMVRWLGRSQAVSAVLALQEPELETGRGDRIRVDVPDLVHALVRFPGQVESVLDITAMSRPEPLACWFQGSRKTLRADFGRGRLELAAPDGPFRRVPISAGERGRWHVERDFVEAIREGWPATLVDFETGWHGMAFTDAVHRAAQEAVRVDIPDAPPT